MPLSLPPPELAGAGNGSGLISSAPLLGYQNALPGAIRVWGVDKLKATLARGSQKDYSLESKWPTPGAKWTYGSRGGIRGISSGIFLNVRLM